MPPPPIQLSTYANRTTEQPISYFMQQAVENPQLISLAAGLVDAPSLPAGEVQAALDAILSRPASAQTALQYGTTQGYAPLRETILARTLDLDGVSPEDTSLTADDVIVTTGSQQLLYLVAEVLLNPGDIVIVEAPSYFVFQSTLDSFAVHTLSVPMDKDGINTDALADLLEHLAETGELDRVKLIYVTDYFQNPTGITLSLPRRQRVLELAQQYSRNHRIVVLEDAAYRELRFDGPDLPTIKSFDANNEYVVLGKTFSKPLAPGLKTGYGFFPSDLVPPVLRLKGTHDFGSVNLVQHVIHHVLDSGAYDRHVARLCEVYRSKRDVLLETLGDEFAGEEHVSWTEPSGGIYIWLTLPPGFDAGPRSRFMAQCLENGMLYVPGQFCYVSEGGQNPPRNEARLCYGVASPEQLREAIRRLAHAYQQVTVETATVS